MRLPAFVRNWLHNRYCCHPYEFLDERPPIATLHEVPDGRGGTVIVPEMKALTAFALPLLREPHGIGTVENPMSAYEQVRHDAAMLETYRATRAKLEMQGYLERHPELAPDAGDARHRIESPEAVAYVQEHMPDIDDSDDGPRDAIARGVAAADAELAAYLVGPPTPTTRKAAELILDGLDSPLDSP